MKNLMYLLLGLLIYPIIPDITEFIDYKFNTQLWIKVGVPSYGLAQGLTGRCDNVMRPSGVTNREYFGCSKVNIFISNILHKEIK